MGHLMGNQTGQQTGFLAGHLAGQCAGCLKVEQAGQFKVDLKVQLAGFLTGLCAGFFARGLRHGRSESRGGRKPASASELLPASS
jgi:hypothetical protein